VNFKIKDRYETLNVTLQPTTNHDYCWIVEQEVKFYLVRYKTHMLT